VDGRHSELLTTLPIILFDGQRLVHVTVDDEKAGAYRALSTAYRLGAGITGGSGTSTCPGSPPNALSVLRVPQTRPTSSRPSQLVISLGHSFAKDAWMRLNVSQPRQRSASSRRCSNRDSQRAGVFGNLLFNAASAAVLAGRPAHAADLLAEAEAAAVRTTADFANEAGDLRSTRHGDSACRSCRSNR